MLTSEIYAVKVDFLVPECIRSQKSIKLEKMVHGGRRTSDAISDTIRLLSLLKQSDVSQKSSVSLDKESQERVKSLLASAKNGSFCVDDQSTYQKKLKKLENLSEELFLTEKRYLETLRILKDISDKVETTDSDQQDLLRDVFKEIPSLYMLHKYLDDKFYNSSPRNPDFGWWIHIFTSAEIAPFFNIYKVFLSRVRTKYEALQSIYDKDKPFQQFCQSLVVRCLYPTFLHLMNECSILCIKFFLICGLF